MSEPLGRSLVLTLLVCTCCGCTSEVVGSDYTDYFIDNGNGAEPWHVISISEGQRLMPAPYQITVGLVHKRNSRLSDKKLIALVKNLPRQRRLDDYGKGLVSVASSLTSDVSRERIRWIVAIDPVIVAEGRTAEQCENNFYGAHLFGNAVVELGGNIRLVSEADLVERVDRLYILTDLPAYLPPDSPPPLGRQIVELDEPQTLREVFASHTGRIRSRLQSVGASRSSHASRRTRQWPGAPAPAPA